MCLRPLRTLLHIGDSVLRNSSAGSQDFAVRHDIPFVSRCGDGIGLQDPHALAAVSGYLDRGRGAICSRRPRCSVVGAGKCYFGPVELSGRNFCPQNLKNRLDILFRPSFLVRGSRHLLRWFCIDRSLSNAATGSSMWTINRLQHARPCAVKTRLRPSWGMTARHLPELTASVEEITIIGFNH